MPVCQLSKYQARSVDISMGPIRRGTEDTLVGGEERWAPSSEAYRNIKAFAYYSLVTIAVFGGGCWYLFFNRLYK